MLIIVTCLLCALICVVGLLAVTRCIWIFPQSPIQQDTTNEGVPNECLKREVINLLPRRIFESGGLTIAAAATSESDKKAAAAADCMTCLAEFVDGERRSENYQDVVTCSTLNVLTRG